MLVKYQMLRLCMYSCEIILWMHFWNFFRKIVMNQENSTKSLLNTYSSSFISITEVLRFTEKVWIFIDNRQFFNQKNRNVCQKKLAFFRQYIIQNILLRYFLCCGMQFTRNLYYHEHSVNYFFDTLIKTQVTSCFFCF
jgi:hypothetical protein